MRIDSRQVLQAGGLKTKPGTLSQTLKEGDKLDARVLSCDKNSVTLKTEDGQVVKARLEPGVTLTEGEDVTLEVTKKEDGVLFLSVGEDEHGDSDVPKNTLAAARGFEDTSLEPQAQKLLELKIPVREETAKAMRELMEANPGMKPEEAAFLASNGITQDSGLIKAALALLSGDAKTDELVGLMLKLLSDTPGSGEEQAAVKSDSPIQDKAPGTDMPQNKTGVLIPNLRSAEVFAPQTKAAIPAQSSHSAVTEIIATGDIAETGETDVTGGADVKSESGVKAAAQTVIVSEQTTLTGFIKAVTEQIFAKSDTNPAVYTPAEPAAQERGLNGGAASEMRQETVESVVPQELTSKDGGAVSHQSNAADSIIPQSDTILQNEFSTSDDIKQKFMAPQVEDDRAQLTGKTDNQHVSQPEPARNDFRQTINQPVQTAREPAQNQQPVQTMREPAQIPQPAQMAQEPTQNQQPVQSQPESVQNQQPVQTAQEPAQNQQPVQTAQEPAQNQKPVQTAQEPAQNRQPVQTAQNPQPVLMDKETAENPQTVQGPVREPAQIIREPVQQRGTEQIIREPAQQRGTEQIMRESVRNPQLVQTGKGMVQNPQTAPITAEQTENANTAQKTDEAAEDKIVSKTLAKILSDMPEFKGTPERALTRFSEMLISTARDSTEPAGDLPEKLSVMLEKMFCRIEKDDDKAGERLRQAKDELYMRLSMIEETVSDAGHPAKTQLLRQTQKLMDNVRLINSIDQFVYMQLPVKIGDENKTADLYVYKRKRGTKGVDPDNVNILLALDLDNIGHWESLVNIKGKEVSLRMEVAGESEKEYFSENTVKLHNLLAEAGFRLSGTSIEYAREETTPLTALSALERLRTGRAGTFDYTI